MAQHQGFTVWLTGMLGAGKTTLAEYIAARLRQVDRPVEILDEDELSSELWPELEGDTKEDRLLISRRLGFVADLLTRNGTATLVACASPYKGVREENRRRIQRYIEVYVDCPTEDLIKRDTTGKYKKALAGEIPNFVGITEPYEPPASPEVTIHTNGEAVESGALRIFQALLDLTYMTPEELKVITGTKMKPTPRGKAARAKAVKGAKAGKGPAAVKAAKPAPAAKPARAAKPSTKGKAKRK
jgi:adenylylsulfate kinase